MNEWKEYNLGEIVEVVPGYAFKGKDFTNNGIPIVKIGDINPPVVNLSECQKIAPEKVVGLGKFKLTKGDFVLAMTGATIGKVGRYISGEIAYLNQRVAKFNERPGISDKRFLYHLITSHKVSSEIINRGLGSAQPNVSGKDIESILVAIPPLPTQKAIAEILSSLDDKIELNNQINQNLEALAQALFKQWFVDFEFPNENGEQYKSSGGEMVDSELGEIPKGWKVYFLNELVECFDSKRVPVSSMERDLRKGEFPYYGAAALMDYIDDYLFDGDYVLMGEDGSVSTADGFPVLQFVSGKFWVNNHAHVLKGKAISTELIHCLLRKTNITHLITGAVQPKLNQGNMNKIFMFLPSNLSYIEDIEELIQSIYAQIKDNKIENDSLIKLRETLLPKLISGELQVNELD